MRWSVGCAAALLCLASCAWAQDNPRVSSTDKQVCVLSPEEYADWALSGCDVAARDAAIARFLAAPETVHPSHYGSYAQALERAGRSAEARAWHARAILRLQIDHAFLIPLLTDPGSLFIMNDPHRQEELGGDSGFEPVRATTGRETQAVMEDAIAWELVAPRRYGLFAAARAHSADRYNDMVEGRELEPSPQMQSLFHATQARVIAAARAWAARQILAEELEAEAHVAVAARRIAREAIEAVPVAARSRITPLRTVKLNCLGAFLPGEALAQDARRAAIFCQGPDIEGEYQIVDLMSGETLQRAPSDSPMIDFDGFAFADGNDVVLAALRSDARNSTRAPFWTMRADRAPAPLALPSPPELTDRHRALTHLVSLSGRYALVLFDGGRATPSIQAIYDLPAQRLIWSEAGRADAPGRAALLIDETADAPALFSVIHLGGDWSGRPVLERLNLITRASTWMDWPEDVMSVADTLPVGPAHPYDERRLLILLNPPGDQPDSWAAYATLVDSATLTTVWRGPREQAPPPSYSRAYCARMRHETDRGPRAVATLMGLGEAIVFDSARPADCATSPDGRTLALLIPPFVHIYRIEPS